MEVAALSEYEKERLERIAQNKRLLATLQINEAVEAFETQCVETIEAVKEKKEIRPRVLTEKAPETKTVRRSGRLKGKAPQYNERALSGHERRIQKRTNRQRHSLDVTNEEVYTDRHAEVLGSYQKERDLFVEGYDKHGMRLKDPIHGATCHQCRQKTNRIHTRCSKCQKRKGYFCGDCLFMRYGENIEEVKEKEDWMCPVCRDICNCSFCRIAKGWAPTGGLYRKAKKKGYQSVAHYLVLRNLSGKENMSPVQKGVKESRRVRGVMTRSMGSALNGS